MLVIFNPALIDVMTVPDLSSSQTNERSKRFRWVTRDNIGRTILALNSITHISVENDILVFPELKEVSVEKWFGSEGTVIFLFSFC